MFSFWSRWARRLVSLTWYYCAAIWCWGIPQVLKDWKTVRLSRDFLCFLKISNLSFMHNLHLSVPKSFMQFKIFPLHKILNSHSSRTVGHLGRLFMASKNFAKYLANESIAWFLHTYLRTSVKFPFILVFKSFWVQPIYSLPDSVQETEYTMQLYLHFPS